VSPDGAHPGDIPHSESSDLGVAQLSDAEMAASMPPLPAAPEPPLPDDGKWEPLDAETLRLGQVAAISKKAFAVMIAAP
jgi:hypothetical protein